MFSRCILTADLAGAISRRVEVEGVRSVLMGGPRNDVQGFA